MMIERTHDMRHGTIHYWVNESPRPALVFLPGLTADHRRFGPYLGGLEVPGT